MTTATFNFDLTNLDDLFTPIQDCEYSVDEIESACLESGLTDVVVDDLIVNPVTSKQIHERASKFFLKIERKGKKTIVSSTLFDVSDTYRNMSLLDVALAYSLVSRQEYDLTRSNDKRYK